MKTSEVSRERLAGNARDGRVLDKFESQVHSYFERVRAIYLQRARAEPQRFRVSDSPNSFDEVRAQLAVVLEGVR